MRCESYDAERIAGLVSEGMQELGVRPSGRVLLKPNVVLAQRQVFPHAFTRPEFLDGVLAATKAHAHDLRELAVGERSGITIPTRYSFKEAGYTPVIRRHGATAHYFDEVRQVPVQLRREGRLRDMIYVPKPIADCDFLINLPKFKAHPWTRLTLGLKNFIGIQDDRHRLVDHNSYLEQKIADLQEVIQPRFIAVDAIVAGQRMMLTPTPFSMGAIVMGTNSCAVDAVCCHMVHVDPADLIHLRLASERGFGPMRLDEIEVGGDFPLDEVQAKTSDFEFCLERIDDYFGGDSNLSCTVGTFPEAHSTDYCWGGCPGALQEAMHIFRGFDSDVDTTMRKIRYVVGQVDGPLELEPGERVVFAGNCTHWEGKLNGTRVSIRPAYRTTHEVDVTRTKSNDMFLVTLRNAWQALSNLFSRHAHVAGCPVTVGDHVNFLSAFARIRNPYLRPNLFMPINVAYLQMRIGRFLNRFR